MSLLPSTSCVFSTAFIFQVECGHLHLLQPGTNFLALRAITRKPLKYFLDKRLEMFTTYTNSSGSENQCVEQKKPKQKKRPYLSRDMGRLFNLARSEGGAEKRMEVYMVAVYLLRILQHMSYFGPKADTGSLTEEEVYIGMLVAHFVTVAERNSQNISQVSREHLNLTSLTEILKKDFKPAEVGYGIHPTLALINHSCDPNTIKIQQGGRTVLLAARRLEDGEEITDNYGALFYSMPPLVRCKELEFECQCEACSNDWPLLHLLSSSLDPTTNGALEKGRVANALMLRCTSQLSAKHYGKVATLSGEYSTALAKLTTRPHRFHFNCYMMAFYCTWARWGNKE